MRDAFATLAGAWNQVAGTVGTVLQDPDLRAQLKLAASSVAKAVGTTISELGAELNRADEEE